MRKAVDDLCTRKIILKEISEIESSSDFTKKRSKTAKKKYL